MAIVAERSLGSSNAAALVTTALASIGETIIVFYAHNTGGTPTGMSDSAGNTYQLVDTAAFNSRASLWFCHVTSTLTSGNSISISGVAASYRLYAYVFSGLDTTLGYDQRGTAGGNVSGTAVQVTLGSTAVADELIVASLAASATTSFTPLTGYTELFDTSGAPTLSAIYRIVSATGVYTPGSTRAASGPWGIVAGTFRVGPLPTNKRNQIILGV